MLIEFEHSSRLDATDAPHWWIYFLALKSDGIWDYQLGCLGVVSVKISVKLAI